VKKKLIIVALVLWCVPAVFSAIVTNTNQSIRFLRFPSGNASTDVDAVYYNPAGLTKLQDGFHLSLQNQTLFQDRTINSTFPTLNNPEYLGTTKVPVYPTFFAVYKKGALALSFGFGPNSGGGSADYDTGLPSFEELISLIPSSLTLVGIPTAAYSAQISFKGKSVYYGFQLNASYAINEMISAAAGIRYIYAVNNLEGQIQNIQINPVFPPLGWTGQMRSAPLAFSTLYGATGNPTFQALAAATTDMAVDVKQVGSGFTPLLSLHLTPAENVKIGVRYEFNTSLELENQTKKDDLGAYPDGEKMRSDVPPILAAGVEYALTPQFRGSVSYTLFLEKQANWEGREEDLDSNSYDLGFALEFDLTQAITISGGYIYTKSGAGEKYQLDSSYDLPANTFCAGARIRLSPMLDLDLGGIYVAYRDQTQPLASEVIGAYKQKYQQTTYGFGIALNFHL
jgi:long-chain fatty acid transport protein